MKKLSLNAKLFLLIFSSLIVATVVSVSITLYTNQQTLMQSTFRHLASIAELKKKELEMLFDDVFVDISIMARSNDITQLAVTLNRLHVDTLGKATEAHRAIDVNASIEAARKYEDHLYSYIHEYHYSELYLIDHDHGHVLFSFNKALIGHNLSMTHTGNNGLYDIWEKSIREKRTVFADLALSAHTEKPVMFIATPVYDDASQMIATLVFQMDYSVISNIMGISTPITTATEEYYLTGPDKLPRSDTRLDTQHRSLMASLHSPGNALIDTLASNAALAGKSGTAQIIDYRGKEVLSAYTPVHVSEDIRWALLAEVDKREVFKLSEQLLYSILLMSLILFPLIIGLTYFLLRQSLIKPINQLTQEILNISQSAENPGRLKASETSELNNIVRSFNILLDSLEATDTKLKHSLIYLKKGEEIAGLGIWALDIATQELFWGENTYKIFGIRSDTPASYETFMHYVHPEDREAVNKAYSDSVQQKCDYRIAHRIIREDGSLGHVEERCSHIYDSQGEITKSIGTIFDVTEQKELEQKLQQLNNTLELKVYEQTSQLHTALEQFKNLFDNTLEAIIISDENRIIDANEKAVAIFGFKTKEQLLKADPKELTADEIIDSVLCSLDDESTPMHEVRLKHQDAHTFPALLKGYSMPTPEGKLWISSILDISNLKEKESQMLRQSRQAMMGEMIAMIAHQWRQPLASISATAATLQMKILIQKYDQTFFGEQLQKISDFSQHLSKTIDDFRNFFKAEKSLSEFTLEEVITSSLRIIESSLQSHNITVERQFEANTTITSYENELKQVILNLLKNAEDIIIERQIEMPVLSVKTYFDGTDICMSVGDNAGGVPDELLGKIFDPYFTTKDELNGTGLGLYMSKTIIEEHCAGTLTLLNTDKGATFIITLPHTVTDLQSEEADRND